MEKEEEFKSLKLKLAWPDEKGNISGKEVRISVNTVKRLDDMGHYTSSMKYTYGMSFSAKLPDHVHAKLLGAEVPILGMGRNENKIYDLKFPKTISGSSIAEVTQRWQGIMDDYRSIIAVEKMELKKVIFYQFTGKSNDTKSTWNSIKIGHTATMSYNYIIGYIGMHGSEKRIHNIDNRHISRHNSDGWIYGLPHVAWTQEHEDFFVNLQKSYEAMIGKIADFEASLTNENIDNVIQNSPLLRLGA